MVRRQTWQARRFEIFESARHFRIESNLDVRFEFEQNLDASHVPIKKLYTLLVSLYFQRSLRQAYRGRKGQKWSEIRFFSNFWPILWKPVAKVDGSMPECAQVSALHMRLHLTLLRKTETVDRSVALGLIRKTRITGGEFEQNLEPSQVPIKKLHTLLVSLYFQQSLRYREVKARNGPKFDFFELLAHPLEPLCQSGWLYARMCAGLCPTYATAVHRTWRR